MDEKGKFTYGGPSAMRPPFGRRRPQGPYISPYGPVRQTVNTTPLHPAQLSKSQHGASFHLYQPQIPLNSAAFQRTHAPYTNAEFHPRAQTPEYQNPLSRTYITTGPVVHEGFIPAPGHEEDDDLAGLYPGYRDSLFQIQSEDEDDSEDERALLAEEERIMRDIENKNDNVEHDSDFSMEDAEEIDDDPDEVLIDEEFDDEEGEPPRRPRSSTRGARGKRRGRPPGKGRGGARGSLSARGKRSGRPKGPRGPLPVADPGPQFKEFQRVANNAYLQKDYRTAIEFATKAIQLNPEIFAAHSLLSEIFTDMGDEQKSLEALIIGAPTKRDKELWFYIIDRVKDIDSEEYPVFTNSNKTAIILDCLRSIISIDSNDYDARSQKLEIESRLGQISRCVMTCRRMLTIRPYDAEILKMMARVGTSSPKQTRIHIKSIIASFDTSIAYFLSHDDPPTSNLDWSLLNIYLDLLDQSGNYARGLLRAKTLSRWIQMRKEETYWDDYEDDREFDIDDYPRQNPGLSRDLIHARHQYALPLEIRIKLGLFRLQLRPPDLKEAMYHFQYLDPEDNAPDAIIHDYPDLFQDVADALHMSGNNFAAIRFYEPLYDIAFEHMTLRNLIGMYSSYEAIDRVEKCEELLPTLQKWSPESLEDMAVLAKFFEDHGQHADAMKRGETVYRFGGGRLLRKMGFQGYAEIQDFFYQEKRRARGKHSFRKARVKKHMKALRAATGGEDESADDGADQQNEQMPLLGPLTDRPKPGLFRTRKSLPDYRPKTFLPDEIPGTRVPMEAIDHVLFKQKLNQLAKDFPEELKAARAQHREIVASFQQLGQLSNAAEEGDEESTLEWISIARELIEEFSTFDLFYSDRKRAFGGYFRRIGAQNELWKESALMVLAVVANNVEDGEEEPEVTEKPDKTPEDFYGIHFDEWFNLFVQYAVFLARGGDEDRCFNTIEVASQSNIFFHSQTYSHQLQICRLACGLALDDSRRSSSAIRWFMRAYPFASHPFRLYGGVNRICSIPAGFATGPSLKVFLRYIKTMDYALLGRDERVRFDFRGNDHINWMEKTIPTDSMKHIKDHDPALLALYAHILMCGGSYTTALNYYFRAFALTPQDPALNLCIGVAYIQHAMKRLSENRQYQIQQGLSFVYRYYELRTKDNIAVYCSEAEFNLGRIWHSLGLVNQAVPAYERCLQLSDRVHAEAKQGGRGNSIGLDDFATEAAFAIQAIYALSGNLEGAERMTERSLIFE